MVHALGGIKDQLTYQLGQNFLKVLYVHLGSSLSLKYSQRNNSRHNYNACESFKTD